MGASLPTARRPGSGLRLDGGQGDAGSVITPFYDSLLVKITASGMSFPIALDRMDRALKEFRIRGVQTNIPFIENVIKNETFRTGQASTTLIDTTPNSSPSVRAAIARTGCSSTLAMWW